MLAHEVHHRDQLRVLATLHRLNHLLRGGKAGRPVIEPHHLAETPGRRLQRRFNAKSSLDAKRDSSVELRVLLSQAAVGATRARDLGMIVETTVGELAKLVALVQDLGPSVAAKAVALRR